MNRDEMSDLTAFLAVAEERSFTKAAVRLGLSQSALSQIVRRLEERLGLRLLTRTTRSVAPTEAGERLLQTLAPAISDLDATLAALSALREKPAGIIRITSVEHAAETVLWPRLREFLRTYPEIRIEIILDYGLTDIVAERLDAGVRLGEQVDRDMIAVRISPEIPMALVGAPSYFDRHLRPKVPQELVDHQCIKLRLGATRGQAPWEFRKGKHAPNVRIDGAMSFNSLKMIREAAIDGFGLAFLPKDIVQRHLDDSRLVSVMADWCPPLPAYHLYFPNRRQQLPAFALLVDALRLIG
ncbi:MAG TPA: LysR family transcriptional regulator [Allosphingosinicella sp.]|jgi:DNA-binding transcriptional LysR family regulator